MKIGFKKTKKTPIFSIGANQHSFNDFLEADYSLITKKII